MKIWKINWKVMELVNGPPNDEGDFADGTKRVLAEGSVEKEGIKEVLKAELTTVLERAFPKIAYNATQTLDRWYEIELEPVKTTDTLKNERYF